MEKKTVKKSKKVVKSDKKEYKVLSTLKGNINGRIFDNKSGDVITLDEFEFNILSRFLESK